ncbi:MAG: DMT family transporter [Actinomycetota bacterium]
MDTAVKSEANHARPPWIAWALLSLGILAASVSAILIRYAEDANPLAISFWRCALGALALLPFARWQQRGATRATVKTSAIAGFFLALHFATWITSVGLTSVASSVLLVSTTPVFTALIAWLAFKERLPSVGWAGIALTLIGVGLIGGGDFGGSSGVGNLLALIGGATVAGYLMLGSVARRTLGIVEYAVVAYTTAGVMLLAVCLVAGVDLGGYDSGTWWAIAGMVVGPQLLGHTVINSVLTEIDATTVAVTIMAEPIIATALAFVLFSEGPSLLIYPGGILILVGIYLVTTVRKEPVVPLD